MPLGLGSQRMERDGHFSELSLWAAERQCPAGGPPDTQGAEAINLTGRWGKINLTETSLLSPALRKCYIHLTSIPYYVVSAIILLPDVLKRELLIGMLWEGAIQGIPLHSHPTVFKGIQQQYIFLIPWTKTMCEDFTKSNNFNLVQGSGKICTYHGISSRELFVLIWVPSLVGILGLSNQIQDMCFHALHLASLQLRLGFW